MKRQRGSAMLFVLIMTISITSIIVATGDLAYSSVSAQEKRERFAKADCAIEAAVARSLSQVKSGTLVLDSASVVAIADPDTAVSQTATDNSMNIAKTISVMSSPVVNGQTYTRTSIVGHRALSKPSYYALFSDDPISISSNVIFGTSGVDGDICSNGSITLTGSTKVFGDIESSNTVTATTLKNVDNVLTGMPAVPFPAFNRSGYALTASSILAGGSSLNTIAFATAYRLIYVGGDLTISGVIAGTGTIYVRGSLSVSGNLSYATAGSRIAFICEGDVKVEDGVTQIVGYYYTGSKFRSPSNGVVLTLSRGGVAARTLNMDTPVVFTHDPAVFTISTEGRNLKLPGFWP